MQLNASQFNTDRSVRGDWQYPPDKHPVGVWGFIHEFWKNYNATYSGTDQYYTSVAKPIGQINSLVASVEWSYTGSTNFDHLTECFLTDAADQFGSHIKAEVGFLAYANASALSYHNSGTDMGIFTDQYGRAWTVRRHPQNMWLYYTLYPQSNTPVFSFSVDFKAIFTYLLARGELSTTWFFNGLGTGVEPTDGGGTGSFLSKLSVTYS